MFNFSKITSFFFLLADASTSGGDNYPGLPSSDSFLEKIIPNVWAFLIQLLALIVLIVVFMVFAYKPVKKIIAARQNKIEESIQSAQKNNDKAKENLKNSELTLIKSQKQADEIIKKAKEQKLVEQQAIVDRTNEEILKMKQDAEIEIERKKVEANDEIKKQIVDVALLASSELLKRETNTKDNEKLIQQFIDDLDKEDGNN